MNEPNPVERGSTGDDLSRRRFLASGSGIAALAMGATAADELSVERTAREALRTVTVGIISDTHVRDTARAEITPLSDQVERYRAFADSMNGHVRPDFVIQLGDLIDGCGDTCSTIVSEDEVVRRIEVARQVIHDRLDMPVYDVLGNHEYRDPTWNKARILRALNPEWSAASDTWYSVSHGGYEFVFLNTGYTDTVSGDHEAPLEEVEWLAATLDRTRRPTFVFMHVPTSQGAGVAYDQFRNQERVKAILARHRRRGRLVAGFFGHCHHDDEWDRMRTQGDDYGTLYYHTTAPHQWMGDVSQVPWAVLTIGPSELTFAVGTGVDKPNGYRTQWTQEF